MKTLDDAWRWYQDTKSVLKLAHRLGEKHWLNLRSPQGGAALSICKDDAFRMLEPTEITQPARNALISLDDLAIVVMFSVFEATVRENTLEQIRPEAATLQHPSLKTAAGELADRILLGSFYRVLGPFRERDPDLTEEVDQVREYRNWVAHGKRKAIPSAVTPAVAYDRLARFLGKFLLKALVSEDEWLAKFRESGE